MNIGIYKPGKCVYFYETEFDHASWSIEVTQIAKLFVSKGHHVIMLSDTDLIPSEHLTTVIDRPIDRIYVFNGVGLTDDILEGLKRYTSDIRLIVTDLKLIPTNLTPYSHIYTQSKQLYEYGAIQEGILFGVKQPEYGPFKDINIYFGGTERNRLNDCIEYLWRPDVIWKGKSEFFGFNNYIPYHEHINMLKRTKYTIIIGDESYNSIGFVTPRFYECALYGVIPFVDTKFDPNELILPHGHFLRVSSYREMMQKIDKLNNDSVSKNSILMYLSLLCIEKKSGLNILEKII